MHALVSHQSDMARRNSEPTIVNQDEIHRSSAHKSSLASNMTNDQSKPDFSPRRSFGPRYKLVSEGSVCICRINHSRNIINKILTSNILRRWESHHIILSPTEIYSTSSVGFMETSVPYSIIEDIHVMSRWDLTQKFCVQINIPDACILIQVNNSHLRDQWLYSLQWKKQVLKYTKILQNTTRPEVLTREIKHLIDLAMNTPLQDEEIHQIPLELISQLLQNNKCIPKKIHENIIIALAPLLENNHPSPEICDFFTKHCKDNPRSTVIIDMFTSVVQRILKHNMCCNLQDFGKYPKMRIFVQEYIQALNSQNNGIEIVDQLVRNMHGQASICPHPGLLPNLVSVILSGIYSCYDEKLRLKRNGLEEESSNAADDFQINGRHHHHNEPETVGAAVHDDYRPEILNNGYLNENDSNIHHVPADNHNHSSASSLRFLKLKDAEINRRLLCYLAMIQVMSTYEDWRPLLSSLLQPIPFPDYSLCHDLFMKNMEKVILNIAQDRRCEVHQALLGVREGKEGWLHLFCPANSIYYYDFSQPPTSFIQYTNYDNNNNNNNDDSDTHLNSCDVIVNGNSIIDENKLGHHQHHPISLNNHDDLKDIDFIEEDNCGGSTFHQTTTDGIIFQRNGNGNVDNHSSPNTSSSPHFKTNKELFISNGVTAKDATDLLLETCTATPGPYKGLRRRINLNLDDTTTVTSAKEPNTENVEDQLSAHLNLNNNNNNHLIEPPSPSPSSNGSSPSPVTSPYNNLRLLPLPLPSNNKCFNNSSTDNKDVDDPDSKSFSNNSCCFSYSTSSESEGGGGNIISNSTSCNGADGGGSDSTNSRRGYPLDTCSGSSDCSFSPPTTPKNINTALQKDQCNYHYNNNNNSIVQSSITKNTECHYGHMDPQHQSYPANKSSPPNTQEEGCKGEHGSNINNGHPPENYVSRTPPTLLLTQTPDIEITRSRELFENESDYFEGKLFCEMLTTLIRCCCRRKKFLTHMNKMLGPCMLLALREQEIAMEVLCAMLELDTIDNHDLKLQIVTTLHSTNRGKKLYADLCDRLAALRELQQKGGPKRLTLPAKSTDNDLNKILSQGSFGNLECLSLAFTHVTSKCAAQLIKLPALKYLNLWSTQFGDSGLQLITEHLHKLQVLNLCETPVTDKGLTCLATMKNLRKLNLNSTNLSAKTFEALKEKLPALRECDIRYTDAW